MTNEEFIESISLLLKGDKNGLRRIYEAYVRLIYSVVFDLVHNKEDAEDITSEFFVKLIRVAKSYNMGSPHKTWLVTIARNMSIDYLRKKSHEFSASVSSYDCEYDLIEEGVADTKGDSLENQVTLSRDLSEAMGTLSSKEKEIVDLKLVGQFKFKEIADMLGQPMGTVTWIYNQGIKKLRRCLSGYETE